MPEPRTDQFDPTLRASGVAKSYGGRRVLADVELRLATGRITGIIGPNGAGKSTLIGVLSGTVRPDAGAVELGGRDVGRLGPRGRARLGLARSFQTPHVFETLTLRQHMLLQSADCGWGYEIASQFGFESVLDRTLGTLSHGMRRLAEICHLAAARPRVLLLDEPAAGLTHFEMNQLAQVLGWLRRHTAIGVVEHNMPFLLPLSDDVIVLDRGRIIAHDTPAAISENQEVRRAYLGPDFKPY